MVRGPYFVAELRFPEHSEFYLVRWVCSTSWWDLNGTSYPAKQPISRKQYERAVRLGKPHRMYLMTSETLPGNVVALGSSQSPPQLVHVSSVDHGERTIKPVSSA